MLTLHIKRQVEDLLAGLPVGPMTSREAAVQIYTNYLLAIIAVQQQELIQKLGQLTNAARNIKPSWN